MAFKRSAVRSRLSPPDVRYTNTMTNGNPGVGQTVSNGMDTYRLWRSAGKPDLHYRCGENDRYYLYVEVNGYLALMGITEYVPIGQSGTMAVDEQYGGETFPDFVGALVMDDLSRCAELSAAHQAMWRKERQAAAVRAAEEEKAFCEEQNRIAEKAVSDAIQVIRNGGVLKNDTVKFYRSRYHASAYSIALYLMRQYHVDVPLRTQGWINNKLVSVTIKDGWCTGERYLCSGKKRGSEKFFIYMDRLIRVVTEQHT